MLETPVLTLSKMTLCVCMCVYMYIYIYIYIYIYLKVGEDDHPRGQLIGIARDFLSAENKF